MTTAAAPAQTIEVERSLGEMRATGRVALAAPAPAAGSPHARLAGARAWYALGTSLLAAGKPEAAAQAAVEGLAELGDDYCGPDVDDDTDLKVLAAEDLVGQGRLQDGAALYLRMLGLRLEMYGALHKADLAQ